MSEEKKPAEHAETPEEETEENQELTEEEEEFIENVSEEDLEDMTQEELARIKSALSKIKSAIKQKKHFRQKWEESDKELNRVKQPQSPPLAKEEPKNKVQNDSERERFEKLEFKQDHSDLTRGEIDEIFIYAKLKGIKPEEAVKAPVIQSMLKERKEREEVEGASPSPKSSHGGMKGQPQNFSRMSAKEFRAHRQKVLSRIGNQ